LASGKVQLLHPSTWKRAWVFAALWALTALYIGIFPTRHYTPDAVNNLNFIEDHNVFEAWHSQHLLAQLPGYSLYDALNGTLRSWQVMRITQAISAGLAVALVYLTLMELTGKTWVSIFGATALWFSYGFWHYNSDPDVYSLNYVAVALLLLLFVRYLRLRRGIGWLAGGAACAVLTHQMNIELVGLIGLSLVWLAWRRTVPCRHIMLFGALTAALVIVVYWVGWQQVKAYANATGEVQVGDFAPWTLRYFGMARSAEATWGVTFSLSNLPLSIYTFVLTWILPPLRAELSLSSMVLLLPLAIGSLLLIVMMPLAFWKRPPGLVAFVCAGTLLANGISGWWWQAGNPKFYLTMQIHLVLLVARFAAQLLEGRMRHFQRLAVGLAWAGLVIYHVLATLPFETRGGIFTVADITPTSETTVYFEESLQRSAFRAIDSADAKLWNPAMCQERPPDAGRTLWVLQSRSDCPALADAAVLGQFQADRSRKTWVIYALP
jgi:hypothetical protein